MVAVVNDFVKTINKTKKMGSYDNWFKSIFKSINSAPLLCAMDILFNPHPNESTLKTIEFGHSIYDNKWPKYIDKFEQEYWKKELFQILDKSLWLYFASF